MRSFLLLLVFSIISVLVSAQSELKLTKIIDAGSIRSTPSLCSKSNDLQGLINETNKEYAMQLCPFAEESNWPSALTTLEKRNAGSRELMKNYNIYYVADIGSDAVLLWIPMEINQHMPEDMRDKTDFLVMIGREAVELGDKVSLFGSTESEEESVKSNTSPIDLNAAGFEKQLINIVADYQYGFKHITGELVKPEDGSTDFGNNFTSLINLEGSVESYLTKVLLSKDLNFIATFGDFLKKEDAIAKYRQLIARIDKVVFPCCTFVKMDEYSSEVILSQAYLPFNLSGNMKNEFKDMLIEVDVTKSFRVSEDFKLTDIWFVVLRVRTNT